MSWRAPAAEISTKNDETRIYLFFVGIDDWFVLESVCF